MKAIHRLYHTPKYLDIYTSFQRRLSLNKFLNINGNILVQLSVWFIENNSLSKKNIIRFPAYIYHLKIK